MMITQISKNPKSINPVNQSVIYSDLFVSEMIVDNLNALMMMIVKNQ